MAERLVFGVGSFDEPDDEPEEPAPAADPEEDGDDWEDRPRSAISKVPEPPPNWSIVPHDRDEALELDEELQLVADMSAERRWIRNGKPSQRARAAVRMDSMGFPIHQIAKRLLFPSTRDAFEVITGTIGSLMPMMDLRTARDRHSSRLEMLFSAVAPRAMNTNSSEQIAYSKQAREILGDIARLHGLNAPQQVQVSTPESDEFNQVLGAIFAHRNPELPKEIDVFDLEEDEDGVYGEPKGDEDAES